MAKFTNHTRGLRGLTLKDGSTTWIEPGQTVEVAKGEIIEPLPDLGTAPAERSDDDDGELAALREQVSALAKQVEDGKTENAGLASKLDDAEKKSAALAKQVEDGAKKP